MKRILFCFLLLIGICLSGCTGQIDQPDTPLSNSSSATSPSGSSTNPRGI